MREKYLNNSEMNPENTKSSIAAIDNVSHAIYRWILAIDMYEKVSR